MKPFSSIFFVICLIIPLGFIEINNNKLINPDGQNLSERVLTPLDANLSTRCQRVPLPKESYGYYLRYIALKPNGSAVHTFNGSMKGNQNIHAAVLDVEVGKKDLQQCADAVMRLKADYLYYSGKYNEIKFNFLSDNKPRYFIKFDNGKTDIATYKKYLEYVYSYANTASLHNQLKSKEGNCIEPGDVYVQKGSPYGHAVTVMDVAESTDGKRYYLLSQSYMPAQDIHILKNPSYPDISPWYLLDDNETIKTPEWTFYKKDLKTW